MRIQLLLAIVLAAAASSVPAVSQSAFPVADRRARLESAYGDIDRLFADFIKTSHVPGAAWGVIIDGELAHSGAAGVRDTVSNTPVDVDTVFRIASMTKSFTAVAILKLRDEGRLSLDDPAERYVPELVVRWDDDLAERIAAENLFMDRSKDRRRKEIEELVSKTGQCAPPDRFDVVENALRGSWSMSCERGKVQVSITLAPTMPPKVQYMSVRSAPAQAALSGPCVSF
jgi:hypothetical protein